jgi:hypothetical protein
MTYKKNQYSSGISICALIIAGIFFYWGFNDLLIKPLAEGVGINWWGLLWLGIGISIVVEQIYNWQMRSKLRNVVLFEYEEHPDATIEMISKNTSITVKDIQAIILDLKAAGLLRGNFSSETGQMVNIELPTETPKEVSTEGIKYCPNCGTTKTNNLAKFCSYCGAKF